MNQRNLTLSVAMLTGALSIPVALAAANDRIIVTATRTAQIADQTLAAVIVISREEIERSQAVDIADLLRMHAGLDISRTGGPGQATSVFLRGTESNHTLVMIDGVKINPGTIGGAALQNIAPELIERIEIVKGPRSTLYGSDAIGGVINIITRRGDSTSVKLKTGSNRLQQVSADLHHHNDNLHSGISIASMKTDGFATFTASTLDRGHTNTSINAYAGTRISGYDVELSHWQASGNTEYTNPIYLTTPPYSISGYTLADQDFSNNSTAATIKSNPMASWATTVKLAQARDELDQNQSSDYAHTTRDTLDWQNDLQLNEQQLLSAGLMLTRENTATQSYTEDTTIDAFYLQDDVSIDKHHIIASARYTDHQSFGNHTTWGIEYGLQLNKTIRINAASGTAFRAPDATDRFGYGGNINLKPETSHNNEIGLSWQLSAQQNVSLRYFDNRLEDMIEWVDDFSLPAYGSLQNTGSAQITGTELDYRVHQDNWALRVSAISQNPENRTTGAQLLRRARNSLSSSLQYDLSGYLIGADLLASDSRTDYGPVKLAGYVVANLSLSKEIMAGLIVRGKVENLLDTDYTLANGYNTAGRSFFAELNYTLAR